MTEREAKIRTIAATRYNVPADQLNSIPQSLRETIERRFHLEPDVEPRLKPSGGESVRDKLYRWKSEDQAAQHDLKQREALANPPKEPSGKQQRITLIQAKLNRTTAADPNYRRRLEEELSQAKRELAQELAEQAEEVKQEQFQEELSNLSSYENALENAQATERLTRDDPNEHVQSLVRLKMLENVKQGDVVDEIVSDYWAGYSKYEQRVVLKEQKALEPLVEQAADSVRQVAEQEGRVIEAEHKAEIARLDSE